MMAEDKKEVVVRFDKAAFLAAKKAKSGKK